MLLFYKYIIYTHDINNSANHHTKLLELRASFQEAESGVVCDFEFSSNFLHKESFLTAQMLMYLVVRAVHCKEDNLRNCFGNFVN